MSRYTKIHEKEGKKYIVAYGFDRPLQSYFLQVFDPEDAEHSPIINHDTASFFGNNLDRGELAALYKEWDLPNEHIIKMILDLPF